MDQDKITITEDSMDIVYYYQENNDSSGDEDQEIAECTTRPVTVSYDSNRHTFDIRPGEGVNLRYSMKEDGPYTIEELPAYTDAGKYTIYLKHLLILQNPVMGRHLWKLQRLLQN